MWMFVYAFEVVLKCFVWLWIFWEWFCVFPRTPAWHIRLKKDSFGLSNVRRIFIG